MDNLLKQYHAQEMTNCRSIRIIPVSHVQPTLLGTEENWFKKNSQVDLDDHHQQIPHARADNRQKYKGKTRIPCTADSPGDSPRDMRKEELS